MTVEINFLAVFLATLAAMVIGYFWYNKIGFGDQWVKLAKIDPKKTNLPLAMGSSIVGAFLMAFVLAHFTYTSQQFFTDYSFLETALLTAFWSWLGFQGLRVVQRDQFNQRRKKETLIHAGNDFVTIMTMGMIIGLLGV